MNNIFEHYKLVLELREKSIDRIATINTFFLSILSGIFISSTVIIGVVQANNKELPFDKYFYLLILIASIGITYIWRNALIQVNIIIKSKTQVILDIERKMFIKPLNLELKFQKLESEKLKFTTTDEFAPNIFMLCLICLLIIYVGTYIL